MPGRTRTRQTEEAPDPQLAASAGQPSDATFRHGIALALLLGLALAALLAYDRHNRIAAASRQATTLAHATERLLDHELGEQERMLRFIARATAAPGARAPELEVPAPAVLVAQIAADRPELADIVLVDAAGRAVTPGADAPGIARWIEAPARAGEAPLRMGPPVRAAGGQWLLPLAVRRQEAGWVVARLRLAVVQDMIERMEAGERSVIAVLDRHRIVLARTRDPERMVGTRIDDPPLIEHLATGTAQVVQQGGNRYDKVPRARAFATVRNYPLVVAAGLSRSEILAPWKTTAGVALAGYALFWAGFLHLMRILRRSERSQRALLERVRRSAALLSMAQRTGQLGAWALLPDGRLWWSDEVPPLYGFPPGSPDFNEMRFYEAIHPDDRHAVKEHLAQIRRSGGDLYQEYRVLLPDGSVRFLLAQGGQVQAADSEIRLAGAVIDITERIETQAKLQGAERQFRLLFDRNPLPFWVFDVHTLRFLEVNEAAVRSYGYSHEEFLSMTLLDIRPPGNTQRVMDDVSGERSFRDKPKLWTHRRKDGSLLEVRVHSADIEFSGRPARLVLAEDVSERQQIQRQLAWRANHDVQTGLPNEQAFDQRLDAMIAAAPQDGLQVARVQLKRLPMIVDSLGATIGDEVLRQSAQRLRDFVGDRGALGRLQDAEFVLALPAGDDQGSDLIARLCELMAEPVWAGDSPHYVDASVGIALYPEDGPTAEVLVRNAGLAVHNPAQAASEGMRYSIALARRMSDRLAMLARLHQAIGNEEFELHFQPIVDLASGRTASYEALLRWPQPGGGYVPPCEFIPLSEDSALIVPLGRWVVHEAARAWRRFVDAGHPPLPIAANISVCQFARSDLVAEMREVMDGVGVPASALELEITEGVVMGDPEQVIRTLAELRALGVRLAIDDFGTGYSNLSYLHRLPVHTLKIDRVFVQGVEEEGQNAAICRSVIALARQFQMRVTAEGIETREQFDWLRANGCDLGQGFLLARPSPLAPLLAAGEPVRDPAPR